MDKNKHTPITYIKDVLANPKDLLTVPNLLVYFRIALSILFLVIYLRGVYIDPSNPTVWKWGLAGMDSSIYLQIDGFLSCALILTCGFTDFLDGFIARKFNQKTKIGVFLDPFADKLLQLFIVVGIAYRWGYYYMVKLGGHAQFGVVWFLLGILLVKETAMVICNAVVYAHTGIHFNSAMWYGKLSTAVLYLTMGVMLFFVNIAGESGNDIRDILIIVLCYICSFALLFSFVMYTIKYVDMYRHPEKYQNNSNFIKN